MPVKKTTKTASRAKTTSIQASSKLSVKIGESYFTVEYSEARSVPEDCDLKLERKSLWDTVNDETDYQIEEIYKTYKKKRR